MRRSVHAFLRVLVAGCALAFGVARPGYAEPQPEPTPASAPARSVESETDARPAMDAARLHGEPEHPAEPEIASDGKRPEVDYDRRGEPGPSAGRVLLWVPRIVFSPLYLVSEYVIRRPLGFLTTAAERGQLPAFLVGIFSFGHSDVGIVPTGLLDFRLRPSVGLYAFWDDAFVSGNALRARFAYGGEDWLMLNLADRVTLNREQELTFRIAYLKRPDRIFAGIGPSTRESATSTYLDESVAGGVSYNARLPRSSSLSVSSQVYTESFALGTGCCAYPRVANQVAAGAYPAPAGVYDDYVALQQGIALTLDTRTRRNLDDAREGSDFVSPPGGGVKLALRGKYDAGLSRAHPLPNAPSELYSFASYGATLGGFVDLTREQRVLGLQLIADFVDPLRRGGTVPLPGLVSLGGARPLRGFLEGRLVDRSAVVALLEYQWPIWVWLDGVIHYAIGNVFGEHLSGFKPNLLRSSFGIGMRSSGARDHAFELLLAFGTETLQQGYEIDSVRFVIGATNGF